MAADTLEAAIAIERVEYWLDWFLQRAGIAIGAVVQRADDTGAIIEKFYFDGPCADDWAALARYRDSYVPTLGQIMLLFHTKPVPDAVSQERKYRSP